MVLVIEGHKYQGRFEIQKRSASGIEMVDTEVGRHPENWRRNWFEGEGSITDNQTGVRERFLFRPKGQSQDYVIILGGGASKTAIRDYKEAIDLALGLMYESVRKSDKPVPNVPLPVLSLEMLSNEKLLQPNYSI